jgi:cell division protein ZapA
MNDAQPVNVSILDREYLVACRADERQALTQAAQLVDERMRELRAGARTASLDRIAVLVALNLANELLGVKNSAQRVQSGLGDDLDSLKRRLDGLVERLAK